MAMPAPSSADWTADMVHLLPDDDNRYEVIDGELCVTPAPSVAHQRASAALFLRLEPYARSVGLELLYAPVAVGFAARSEVQPDLVAWTAQRDGGLPDFREAGCLTLAVEILSPATARVDRHRKRALYQRQGTAEYWIVDAANRMIERWRPRDAEPEIALETMCWQPRAGHAALQIDVGALFREVHREA